MKTGQITPQSHFGQVLVELAKESRTIIEVGTWNGAGSTTCLLTGQKMQDKLLSVEADEGMYREAHHDLVRHIDAYHLTLFHGVVTNTILPYYHPHDSNVHKEMWAAEARAITSLPALKNSQELSALLAHNRGWIDLLLLDGGEWTSLADFMALWRFSKVIALDDTNPARSVKNWFARDWLIKAGWNVLHDRQADRNGWFVARRVG